MSGDDLLPAGNHWLGNDVQRTSDGARGCALTQSILDFGPSFGVQPNGFGFRVSWATNANVVVEASADLASPTWSPVSTNTLTDGWVDFTDAEWAKYPARFYRVRGE